MLIVFIGVLLNRLKVGFNILVLKSFFLSQLCIALKTSDEKSAIQGESYLKSAKSSFTLLDPRILWVVPRDICPYIFVRLIIR